MIEGQSDPVRGCAAFPSLSPQSGTFRFTSRPSATETTRQDRRSKMAKTAKQAVAEPPQSTPTEQATPQVAETARPAEGGQAPDELKASRLPDVREMKSINLGPDRDSPRLRLLCSFRFNQMQIRSDERSPRRRARSSRPKAGETAPRRKGSGPSNSLRARALMCRRTLSRRHPPGRWSLTPRACFTKSPTPSGPTGD